MFNVYSKPSQLCFYCHFLFRSSYFRCHKTGGGECVYLCTSENEGIVGIFHLFIRTFCRWYRCFDYNLCTGNMMIRTKSNHTPWIVLLLHKTTSTIRILELHNHFRFLLLTSSTKCCYSLISLSDCTDTRILLLFIIIIIFIFFFSETLPFIEFNMLNFILFQWHSFHFNIDTKKNRSNFQRGQDIWELHHLCFEAHTHKKDETSHSNWNSFGRGKNIDKSGLNDEIDQDPGADRCETSSFVKWNGFSEISLFQLLCATVR